MHTPLTPEQVRILGRKLHQARERSGYSGQDVADAVGIRRRFLYKIHAGGATPSLKVLVDLASFYGLSIDDLLDHVKEDAYHDLDEARLQSHILEESANGRKLEVGVSDGAGIVAPATTEPYGGGGARGATEGLREESGRAARATRRSKRTSRSSGLRLGREDGARLAFELRQEYGEI